MICAVAVPAVFFIYFLPHSLPALSLDFLSNSDIAIENIAPAVLLIYAVGLLEILCGAISIYAALLLKAGRTSKNAVNSVFIVLDCLLSIYLLLFGIGSDTSCARASVPNVATASIAVKAAVMICLLFMLLLFY